MTTVLEVRGLSRIYGAGNAGSVSRTGPQFGTNMDHETNAVVACAEVSFTLATGEILGIMGESGSGKSTVIRCLGFDDAPSSGSIYFHHHGARIDCTSLTDAERRWLKIHRIGTVYQNPHLGLNFSYSAGGNIAERLLYASRPNYGAIRARARELLSRTEVPAKRMDEKPSNFSGGMQQRVQISKALANDPPLLLLDEVTTGLDVSVQAAILDLILELQRESGVAMVAVTHDLGVIRHLASRTLVMQHGRVVEAGLTDQILEDPQHPYTQRLVASAL
ncbi:MAG: ATP-binding cassette domain-containing protein [Planctomycetota bacterium]|nr:MAG: ATP-binding cassette domain-containing protein [Planctomycetota bacterium]